MSDRLNYNTLAPAAMKALGGVHVYLHSQADLPKNLIDLAYLRTSQINGCAYCIDMHSHDLIAQGVPVSKLLLVSAWHEADDIFDMRERGVLAWTETVTDVARTGVPDDAYAAALAIFSEKELADLTVAVGVMGAYNRLAAARRAADSRMGNLVLIQRICAADSPFSSRQRLRPCARSQYAAQKPPSLCR